MPSMPINSFQKHVDSKSLSKKTRLNKPCNMKKAQGWGFRVIHCDNKSGFDNLQAHHLPYGYYFQALFLLQPGKKNNQIRKKKEEKKKKKTSTEKNYKNT